MVMELNLLNRQYHQCNWETRMPDINHHHKITTSSFLKSHIPSSIKNRYQNVSTLRI